MSSMTWSYPPRRILVPVDFGEASGRALAVAVRIAREFGSALEILHVEVLEAPPYFTHEQVKALEAQRVAARAAAQRYLARFAEKHGAGGATLTIADGTPASVILQRAAGADAIVMGTNERSLASRLWMGSVAERVSRETAIPVVIVRTSDPLDVAPHLDALGAEAKRRKVEL
ncbi:MAG TPA: universal stress protein [Vicinamibacterales bacterium]|nr:universal stress protein [Vicinamibacterales bacterium]